MEHHCLLQAPYHTSLSPCHSVPPWLLSLRGGAFPAPGPFPCCSLDSWPGKSRGDETTDQEPCTGKLNLDNKWMQGLGWD